MEGRRERERTRTDTLKLSPDLHMWSQHEHRTHNKCEKNLKRQVPKEREKKKKKKKEKGTKSQNNNICSEKDFFKKSFLSQGSCYMRSSCLRIPGAGITGGTRRAQNLGVIEHTPSWRWAERPGELLLFASGIYKLMENSKQNHQGQTAWQWQPTLARHFLKSFVWQLSLVAYACKPALSKLRQKDPP